MTDPSRSPGITPDRLLGALLRQSVPFCIVAGSITALVYAVVDGLPAAAAAMAGLVTTLAFFGVDVLVLHVCRRLPPGVLVAALLGEYVLKVLVLSSVVWTVYVNTNVDLHALAVGVVVSVVALVAAMTKAAITTRSFYFDPGGRSSTAMHADGGSSAT